MIEFQLNDEFTIAQGKDKLKIKITALAPQETTFTVSGRNVENPKQPRQMSTLALAKWLIMNNAKRTKRQPSSQNS